MLFTNSFAVIYQIAKAISDNMKNTPRQPKFVLIALPASGANPVAAVVDIESNAIALIKEIELRLSFNMARGSTEHAPDPIPVKHWPIINIGNIGATALMRLPINVMHKPNFKQKTLPALSDTGP